MHFSSSASGGERMGKYGHEISGRPRMGAASVPARESQDGERKNPCFLCVN